MSLNDFNSNRAQKETTKGSQQVRWLVSLSVSLLVSRSISRLVGQ